MRRVTFVTSFFHQPRGGLGRYENELVKGFEGHPEMALEVAQLGAWTPPALLTRPAKALGYDLQTAVARHLPLLPKGGTLYHLSHQLLGFAALHKRLHDRRRGQHTAIVITVHDLFPEAARREGALSDLAPTWNAHQRWLYRQHLTGIRRADAIIAISEATARDVHAYLGVPWERIRVVYQGFNDFSARQPELTREAVTTLRARWQLAPKERLVLYVGSQDPRKNLPTLIQAVQLLRKEGLQVTLLVVGSPRVGAGERVKGPDDLVRFTGHVDDVELAALYRLADVFAFPSRFEGFGLPPLEAMAYGCPVVASNASAIPEVVGDAGLLVPPTDPSAWAAGIARLLQSEPLRGWLIAKGRVRATQFPWRRTVEGTAAVYRELLRFEKASYVAA